MQFQSMKDFLYLTGQMWDDDVPHHLMSWRPDLPVRIDRLIAGCCGFCFFFKSHSNSQVDAGLSVSVKSSNSHGVSLTDCCGFSPKGELGSS